VSGAPPVEAIEIAAYSPEWPVLFEASKELIAQALPNDPPMGPRFHIRSSISCAADGCSATAS